MSGRFQDVSAVSLPAAVRSSRVSRGTSKRNETVETCIIYGIIMDRPSSGYFSAGKLACLITEVAVASSRTQRGIFALNLLKRCDITVIS